MSRRNCHPSHSRGPPELYLRAKGPRFGPEPAGAEGEVY